MDASTQQVETNLTELLVQVDTGQDEAFDSHRPKQARIQQWKVTIAIAGVLLVLSFAFCLTWALVYRPNKTQEPTRPMPQVQQASSQQPTSASTKPSLPPTQQRTSTQPPVSTQPSMPQIQSPAPAQTNLCLSKVCVTASSMLQQNVDLSVDPCQDFYGFACGGFLKRPYRPETVELGFSLVREESDDLNAKLFDLFRNPELARSDDPEISNIYQAVRDMFKSCIAWHNPKAWWLGGMQSSLWKRIPSWEQTTLFTVMGPLVKKMILSSSLEELLATLVKMRVSGLIKLMEFDSNDKLELLKSLKSTSKGPFLAFETMDFKLNLIRDQLASDEKIRKVFSHLGVKLTENVEDLKKIRDDLAHRTAVRNDTFEGTLTELQQKTNMTLNGFTFNWVKFIREFYATPLRPLVDMPIVVSNFGGFMDALKSLAPELIERNIQGPQFKVIIMDAAVTLASFLQTTEYKSLFTSNNQSQSNSSQSSSPYWTSCTNLARDFMTPVVSDMFKKAYIADNLTRMDSLLTEIENAFKQNVDEESWIQTKSKQAIKTKIDSIKRVISYYQLSSSDIKSLFKEPTKMLRRARNFGDILTAHNEATFQMRLWLQTSATSTYDSFFTLYGDPFQVNAFYMPIFNSINILTGILDTYLYNKDYPDYLLYGGIGWITAHEISHAFGPSGSMYDAKGNLIGNGSIFDENSRAQYKNKSECLVASYNRIETRHNEIKIDGTATFDENFADIVGINAAFIAYRNKVAMSGNAAHQQLLPGVLSTRLTPDQVFFVQSAQFHCNRQLDMAVSLLYSDHAPPEVRATGTMLHSKHFSSVFHCKRGDRMHLDEAAKCHFW